MAFPCRTTGSLCPAFASARPVRLAVKLPCAIALHARLPTALRELLWAPPLLFRRQPPQLNYPPDTVPWPAYGSGLESRYFKGGISRLAPRGLAPPLQSLPPILHMKDQDPISGYSKGARGLSVQSRVSGIFTAATVSPSSCRETAVKSLHHSCRSELTRQEFRYLRTVIVTAAVYRGFSSELRLAADPSL